MNNIPLLIGPFAELLPMTDLPSKGPIQDIHLRPLKHAGVVVAQGAIVEIGEYHTLFSKYHNRYHIDFPAVALPGLIDCHTHLCFAGSRAADYALRLSGVSYSEIAARGGGILETVAKTQAATKVELIELMLIRTQKLLQQGITTCEVKSGYGLTLSDELKMLETINAVTHLQPIELVPTCLAAHVKAPHFPSNSSYLDFIVQELFSRIKDKKLARRVDIFIDEHAFSVPEARSYLQRAVEQGFAICMHADQFNGGSSHLAAELKAVSADHLECATEEDLQALAAADVIAVTLPGACLGLGISMPPARLMLDCNLAVAIASDWNPGSAPMGQLLTAAALLGVREKLSMAETLAGITIRAARALAMPDRGQLKPSLRADLAIFPCNDYREILYRQGALAPKIVVVQGIPHEVNRCQPIP